MIIIEDISIYIFRKKIYLQIEILQYCTVQNWTKLDLIWAIVVVFRVERYKRHSFYELWKVMGGGGGGGDLRF